MPCLENSQHERFVLELIAGKSQTDAYLAAGYKARNASSAAAAASRLFKNDKIQARLSELNKAVQNTVVDDTSLTLSEHMAMLRMLRDEARAEGKLQAAIAAEVKRGELRRFYVKQVETGGVGEFADLSDDELNELIREEAERVVAEAKAARRAN